MHNYYQLLFKDGDGLGVAHALTPPQVPLLPNLGFVKSWEPLQFELRDGKYPDYLSSDLGCRLCSERLRDILDRYAPPLDALQWLDVAVDNGAESRGYYVLHFPHPPDVLHAEKTVFAGDFVVKAVLSKHAAEGHRVFGYPNCGQLPVFISEEVRQSLRKEKCTGIQIAGVPAV